MKNIIRYFLTASVLAAAGMAATTTSVFAQAAPADATVNFQGLVGSVCTFSNAVAGEIVVSNPGFITSDPGFGGVAGSVDLSCTGSAELSVSAPQENGSTTDLLTTANFYKAFATFDAVSTSTDDQGVSTGPAFMSGPVDGSVVVSMELGTGNPIPEGAYNYNVVVTAAPL